MSDTRRFQINGEWQESFYALKIGRCLTPATPREVATASPTFLCPEDRAMSDTRRLRIGLRRSQSVFLCPEDRAMSDTLHPANPCNARPAERQNTHLPLSALRTPPIPRCITQHPETPTVSRVTNLPQFRPFRHNPVTRPYTTAPVSTNPSHRPHHRARVSHTDLAVSVSAECHEANSCTPRPHLHHGHLVRGSSRCSGRHDDRLGNPFPTHSQSGRVVRRRHVGVLRTHRPRQPRSSGDRCRAHHGDREEEV